MIARFAAKVRVLLRRYSGVRARSAIAAAVVVALVLAVAAAAFVLLYRRALIADVGADANRRAQAVAADTADTARPNALPA
ncbi:hypothetical protein, partial [Streptomyces sp. SID3343]|uniref:hypothetical protein n=1 Tax=Streptomyces sp. SID3343 TaxID=2690260 RepID=UPI0013C20DBB